MSTLLIRNPRFLFLLILLLAVAGSLTFMELPRMEDPQLTPRAATVTTLFPGADPDRVDSLITEKLENELKEIEEIKELSSESRPSVSVIGIELLDTVTPQEVPAIWSRIRDKIDDARNQLPPDAGKPEFEQLDIKAYALIVGLRWELDTPPRWAVLRRLAKQLKEQVDILPGTERSDIFGAPNEEIVVSLRPEVVTSLGLNAQSISRQIMASDAKVSAGQLHGPSTDMLFEVSGELDSITRLSHIPIQLTNTSVVELGDVATIERSVQTPLSSKVIFHDRNAVALCVLVESTARLDRWMKQLAPVMEQFTANLPPGVELETVFEQDAYVSARMQNLLANLLYGVCAVFAVVFVIMGTRSALIVSLSLPLGCLFVLFTMYAAGIPIHQMSITGLIIALGLMIDNAIVAVDEVDRHMRQGQSPVAAVASSVRFLAAPLLASTLTTVYSFGPIALMAGPSGEFVGSIASVTIIAVSSSLLLALTIVVSVAGLGLRPHTSGDSMLSRGVRTPRAARGFRRVLCHSLRFPRLTALLLATPPLAGFAMILAMDEQFFPPADRAQFQIELELPGTGALQETELLARQIADVLREDPEIEQVSWFLGESAPPFYYNLIPDRKGSARYGQAIIDCRPDAQLRPLIRRVQAQLNEQFPAVICLARQLEQGPPFAAPIEVQLFGPDPEQLRALGDQVRLLLTETADVILTRSDFSESLPKVTFTVDEHQARLAGLDHVHIANELAALLEGITGGSILEETEELPVRVRIANDLRGNLNRIASLDLMAMVGLVGSADVDAGYQGVPLASLASLQLGQENGAITRLNGVRMNEVQAFIRAGVLPATVQKEFERRLATAGFQLPPGYRLSYAGAAAERDDAVGHLVVNGAILFTLMVVTLVLATNSFRLAGLLFLVALLAVGFSFLALWAGGFPWGFMTIVGMMGMIGIAVNDSIVVLAALQELPSEDRRNPSVISDCVLANSRHVFATTLTTMAGFMPLFTGGGDFWPPLALCISAGVAGATGLALFLVPCVFLLSQGRPRQTTALVSTLAA